MIRVWKEEDGYRCEIVGNGGDLVREMKTAIIGLRDTFRGQEEDEEGYMIGLMEIQKVLEKELRKTSKELRTVMIGIMCGDAVREEDDDADDMISHEAKDGEEVKYDPQIEDDGKNAEMIAKMEEALRKRMLGEDK